MDIPDGKNNGTVNDIKYFDTEPMHGLFVKRVQVKLDVATSTNATATTLSPSGKPINTTKTSATSAKDKLNELKERRSSLTNKANASVSNLPTMKGTRKSIISAPQPAAATLTKSLLGGGVSDSRQNSEVEQHCIVATPHSTTTINMDYASDVKDDAVVNIATATIIKEEACSSSIIHDVATTINDDNSQVVSLLSTTNATMNTTGSTNAATLPNLVSQQHHIVLEQEQHSGGISPPTDVDTATTPHSHTTVVTEHNNYDSLLALSEDSSISSVNNMDKDINRYLHTKNERNIIDIEDNFANNEPSPPALTIHPIEIKKFVIEQQYQQVVVVAPAANFVVETTTTVVPAMAVTNNKSMEKDPLPATTQSIIEEKEEMRHPLQSDDEHNNNNNNKYPTATTNTNVASSRMNAAATTSSNNITISEKSDSASDRTTHPPQPSQLNILETTNISKDVKLIEYLQASLMKVTTDNEYYQELIQHERNENEKHIKEKHDLDSLANHLNEQLEKLQYEKINDINTLKSKHIYDVNQLRKEYMKDISELKSKIFAYENTPPPLIADDHPMIKSKTEEYERQIHELTNDIEKLMFDKEQSALELELLEEKYLQAQIDLEEVLVANIQCKTTAATMDSEIIG